MNYRVTVYPMCGKETAPPMDGKRVLCHLRERHEGPCNPHYRDRIQCPQCHGEGVDTRSVRVFCDACHGEGYRLPTKEEEAAL